MASPAIIGFEDLEPVPFHLWGMFLYVCHLRQGEIISAQSAAKRFHMDWRTAAKQLSELVALGLADRTPGPNKAYCYFPSDRWRALDKTQKNIELSRGTCYAFFVG
jgi:predicted transcriptional regulator